MRRNLSLVRLPVKLNLTPMIDVTFQLILFFLLAGHLAQQESSPEIDLPVAQTAHTARETKNRRLVINVLAEGTIVLSGEHVDLERLDEVLKTEANTRELPEVRIRTDRHVPYGVIASILLRCADAGIWNVSFAVIGEDTLSPEGY